MFSQAFDPTSTSSKEIAKKFSEQFEEASLLKAVSQVPWIEQSHEETKEQLAVKGDHTRLVQLMKQKAVEIPKEKQALVSRISELEGLVCKQIKGIIELRFK